MNAPAPSVHVEYPAAAAVTVGTVPATIAGPEVGVNVASAGHRSHMTVPADRDAKVRFVTRYPYDGFGTSTTAAHSVADKITRFVFETPESTPPGALVVSASTTVEPSVCGPGVLELVGVNVDDGVAVGVKDGVGDTDGVPEREGDCDGVPERVPDGVGDCDGVCVDVDVDD